MTGAPGLHLYLANGSSSVNDGLAGAMTAQDTADQPFKMLLSYWYFRKVNLDDFLGKYTVPVQVFADSGAYSAGMQGVDIDIVDYARWLKQWAHHFETFVNLDVVHYTARDPEADARDTLVNQRRMEDELGIRPVPVFHGGEPLEYLERYCAEYPYVAIGGMVGAPAVVLRWLVRCFEIGREHGAVFHGFGQTKHKIITKLPFYSVDSSSWGGGHRYGGVDLWDGRAHKFVTVRVGGGKATMEKAALIREHGVDPKCIADREHYHQRYAIACAARAWRKYELWLRRLHGEVPLPGRKAGLHLYLAEGSTSNLIEAGRVVGEGRTG